MVANNSVDKEIEFPLAGFTGGKCGRVTDIAKRVLSNRDACLLLLAANGPICKTNTLQVLLRAWRPLEGKTYAPSAARESSTTWIQTGRRELNFTYLFNSYYGHICRNPEGRPSKSYFGGVRTKAAFFWTNKRGQIRISLAGYKRLSWLLDEMDQHGVLPKSLLDHQVELPEGVS
jgi:hypothetical protein